MVELAKYDKENFYLAEIEFKFCIALNCKGYPSHEGSPIFKRHAWLYWTLLRQSWCHMWYYALYQTILIRRC